MISVDLWKVRSRDAAASSCRRRTKQTNNIVPRWQRTTSDERRAGSLDRQHGAANRYDHARAQKPRGFDIEATNNVQHSGKTRTNIQSCSDVK